MRMPDAYLWGSQVDPLARRPSASGCGRETKQERLCGSRLGAHLCRDESALTKIEPRSAKTLRCAYVGGPRKRCRKVVRSRASAGGSALNGMTAIITAWPV